MIVALSALATCVDWPYAVLAVEAIITVKIIAIVIADLFFIFSRPETERNLAQDIYKNCIGLRVIASLMGGVTGG